MLISGQKRAGSLKKNPPPTQYKTSQMTKNVSGAHHRGGASRERKECAEDAGEVFFKSLFCKKAIFSSFSYFLCNIGTPFFFKKNTYLFVREVLFANSAF